MNVEITILILFLTIEKQNYCARALPVPRTGSKASFVVKGQHYIAAAQIFDQIHQNLVPLPARRSSIYTYMATL